MWAGIRACTSGSMLLSKVHYYSTSGSGRQSGRTPGKIVNFLREYGNICVGDTCLFYTCVKCQCNHINQWNFT